MAGKKLIIFDSNSVIHRAFHALPPLTTKKGELVNAVYGFLLVFLRVIREFQPDFIAAAFDLPGPTFRHKEFPEYKAKRPPTPDELSQQIPKIKEILRVFNVPILEKQGFEADDIIGTLASRAAEPQDEKQMETIIVSGDLDNLQLIDGQTKVYALRKGVKDIILYDEEKVKEKYQGLIPGQLVDYKALKGDPSDNISGVKGIGEKTAISLILKFNDLENLYNKIEKSSEKAAEIPQRIKELLIKNKDQAFLSKKLAQIEKRADIDFDLEKCRWQTFDKQEAIKIFEKFEFYSLIPRLP